MDINSSLDVKRACDLVPIALGKYLFSFRTQQSSPVAPIILRKRETRKVPNYQKITLSGDFLVGTRGGLFLLCLLERRQERIFDIFACLFRGSFGEFDINIVARELRS